MFSRQATLILGVTLIVSAVGAASAAADVAGKTIYKQTARATVAVFDPSGQHMGTGSLIDRERKLIVTNEHVVNAWGTYRDRVEVLFPLFKNGEVVADKKAYADLPRLRARLVDYSLPLDLAIIQVLDPLPEGAAELKLAAESAEAADRVHEVGHPSVGDAYWIYSSGTVRQRFHFDWHHTISGRRADRSAMTLRTQLPTNPGDSGGPVVNDRGELVGVHSSGGGGSLMLIHIDVSEVRRFLAQTRRLLEPKTQADHLLISERLLGRNKSDAAIEAFTRLLQADPKCAAAYRGRARAFYQKKDYDTAIVDLDQAIQLDPRDAVALYYRGSSYEYKGESDKALPDFNRAIALDPKYSYAYNERGLIYAAKRDYRRAEADYTRAIKANPKEAAFWANRGYARLALKDYQKAFDDGDTAIAVNPYCIFGWKARGACLRELKLYDEHVKNFQQAVKELPGNPDIWCGLGDAFTWKDQWDKAIGCYSRALELNKDLAYGYWSRGWALENVERLDLAQADYQRALDLDPKEYKGKLQTYRTADLRIFNDTKETIRVYLQYEYQTKDGQWAWYSQEPKKGKSWTVGPGKKSRVSEDDVPIHCRRYRIWAESVDGNAVWNQPKDKDFQACPDQGYLARSRPVRTHRLSK